MNGYLTSMRSGVSLEVESVIETFLTESAQVTFYVAVVFHVSVHETLQLKCFLTYFAFVFVFRVVNYFDSYFD